MTSWKPEGPGSRKTRVKSDEYVAWFQETFQRPAAQASGRLSGTGRPAKAAIEAWASGRRTHQFPPPAEGVRHREFSSTWAAGARRCGPFSPDAGPTGRPPKTANPSTSTVAVLAHQVPDPPDDTVFRSFRVRGVATDQPEPKDPASVGVVQCCVTTRKVALAAISRPLRRGTLSGGPGHETIGVRGPLVGSLRSNDHTQRLICAAR